MVPRSLLLFIILTLPASAQRKLWTWAPPDQADHVALQVLTSAAAPSGATVIVYALVDFSDPSSASFRFRAAFISGGKALAIENLPFPRRFGLEEYFGRNPSASWRVLSISKAASIVSDGEHLVTFKTKGKTATAAVQKIGIDDEIIPSAGGADPVPAFLKRARTHVGNVSFEYGGRPVEFFRSPSIELWSLK